MIPILLYLLLAFGFSESKSPPLSSDIFRTDNGKVSFISKASLENIKASSGSLRGVIDANARKFAFSLQVSTFDGFNSPLQKTHFNENYLQTAVFPSATFEGKLIDVVSLQKEGTYNVKAVGKLTIHGVSKEIMVGGVLIKKGNKITLSADFEVLLSDFEINIPKIVEFKIAKSVQVHVACDLKNE